MAWAARRLLIATKSQNELRDPDPGVSVVVGPGKGCCELGGDVVLVVDVVLRWGAVVVVEVEGTADSGRGVVVEVVAGTGAVAAGEWEGAVAVSGLSSDVHPTGGDVAPV
jgi:hypothetical protein